jgi:hypothetical protein
VFSFTIFVDTNNLYQLVDSSPSLRLDQSLDVVQELNQTNNIAKFVTRTRKMFVQYVRNQQVV